MGNIWYLSKGSCDNGNTGCYICGQAIPREMDCYYSDGDDNEEIFMCVSCYHLD